ncbi:9638_t:CDS:10 [Ambispora gerdemannii]|uniref:9638_t:CDS:1 n=1 Tax=Ambispora gerdemannii TaxID=144530 RepID=A0A9N8VYJ1_9GLOM|nr:9638_t:CDS:10 [Ambispora gerdemannii]
MLFHSIRYLYTLHTEQEQKCYFCVYNSLLLKVYFDYERTAFLYEYLSVDHNSDNHFSSSDKIVNWKQEGASIMSEVDASYFRHIIALSVVTDNFYRVLVPFTLLCNSQETEFQVCRVGEFPQSWKIKFTKGEINDASFCAATLLDGPSVLFVFQSVSFVNSDMNYNNTFSILWRPTIGTTDNSNNAINATTIIKISANFVYGILEDHSHYEKSESHFRRDTEIVSDDIYGRIFVIYCPLNESCIKIKYIGPNDDKDAIAFEKNPFLNSVPGTFARNASCLLPKANYDHQENPRWIWIGTIQEEIVCLKCNCRTNISGWNDYDTYCEWKVEKCIQIPEKPVLIKEVIIHDDSFRCNSVLIVLTDQNNSIIINSENGIILEEISNGFMCAHGDFFSKASDQLIKVPISNMENIYTWSLINLNCSNLNDSFTIEGDNIESDAHLSSKLESLNNRVIEEKAKIKKLNDSIKAKQEILLQCNSLLDSMSDVFQIEDDDYTTGSTTNLRRKHAINNHKQSYEMMRLLSINSSKDYAESSSSSRKEESPEKKYIEVEEARTILGGTNLRDELLFEVTVKNAGSQNIYDVHLTLFIKKASRASITSITKSRAKRIPIISTTAEKVVLTSVVDIPMGAIIDGSEFGAQICFRLSANLNYEYEDPFLANTNQDWKIVCVNEFSQVNKIICDERLMFPTVIDFYLLCTNTIPNQSNLSVIPNLLEQIGAWETSDFFTPNTSEMHLPRAFQAKDEFFAVLLYPMTTSNMAVSLVDTIKLQIQAKTDRAALDILRKMKLSLPEDILFIL